jgi:hypothetical protein
MGTRTGYKTILLIHSTTQHPQDRCFPNPEVTLALNCFCDVSFKFEFC